MQADIITIGDEILIGQIVDTNSKWIANQLEEAGVKVRQITSVSDEKKHILSSLDSALISSDLVILTGGLGPTNDDVTKYALCEFFKDKLVFRSEVFEDIKALFVKRDRRINFYNKKQAMVPSQCQLFRNSIGTAPGMCFEKNRKLVLSLPGVPYEMKHLMREFLPLLKQQFQLPFIIHKVVLLRGIVESHLAELIEPWEKALPKLIKLAYLPSKGVIRLRFTARGDDKSFLHDIINDQIEKLREIAGNYFCPFQELKIELIIGELLKINKQTLGTAESCTGGKIAHRITSVPGSSNYFKGAVVAYSEEIKITELGVESTTIARNHIVSKEVVVEMAQGARNKLNVDYALATSGIAGPSGAEEDIPIGTVCVALATPNNTIAETFYIEGSRVKVIDKATEKALLMLKKTLENN
ncbi:MAG: competence/damage-inducible protein A [Flavobacteriales bacterium]|nr:competence/damage-inducible protein A [Flavobacteriales bacterium]|tara:strand:+ start:28444 stop:29682 length:1239 start_codon:yes stop_codon:yes gene_type:complete